MTPLWVAEAAEGFWEAAGEVEPFPRDLHVAIANAVPVTVVLLPRLRLRDLDRWLLNRGIDGPAPAADRPLRGGLVTRFGQGFIFLDGADPPDEQRFSLAHELAHFLHDYTAPRTALHERLGPAALAAFDGERPPRPEERIRALLTGARLDFAVHLLERGTDGRLTRAEVAASERDADRLACELLAPARDVLREPLPATGPERRVALRDRLTTTYGLPPAVANRYVNQLTPASPPSDALLRRLRWVT